MEIISNVTAQKWLKSAPINILAFLVEGGNDDLRWLFRGHTH